MAKESKKIIYFLVSNDLQSDQRMQRICTTLNQDFVPSLIGRKLSHSKKLQFSFSHSRIACIFNKGKLFYIELQLRFFFHLLRKPMHAICAVDTDTLLAAYALSFFKGIPLGYDAHELFVEVPELEDRPISKSLWKKLEQIIIPRTKFRYTVCQSVADVLEQRYGLPFYVIRNVPYKIKIEKRNDHTFDHKIIWYQGVLNVGRGLEESISALHLLPGWTLEIAGRGDLSEQLKELAEKEGLVDRVTFHGHLNRIEMQERAKKAFIGLNLLHARSLNYYYSLANKFFDYVQTGLPQLNMCFPEYQNHMKQHKVGIFIEKCTPDLIAGSILKLHADQALYQDIKNNIRSAAEEWIWENEEQKLMQIYETNV